MRHTLQEFMNHYNPEHIQLVFGVHLVNIETAFEGSGALVRALNDTKFDFVVYDKEHSYLRLQH